ncbi:MAG: phosphatase PAP2 family protein [Paludibacteraceae bacterium]|nr:phosphatase PAP2 family protein [Paludibacteraceae bacterium]
MKLLEKILNVLARLLSGVLYPLFAPTYGMLLFCAGLSPLIGNQLPLTAWLISVGMTFLLTLFIPLTAIMIRIRRGKIADIYITDPAQRTVPYLYTLVGYGFWCYFVVQVLHAPVYVSLVVIGATVALALVMLINRWWKISAHLAAMGGLVGGVMSHLMMGNSAPVWLPLLLMAVSLLLMYARIYLRAHDPLQVIAGFLLGLIMTLIPNCILSYVV